jgi:hypothetical protein
LGRGKGVGAFHERFQVGQLPPAVLPLEPGEAEFSFADGSATVAVQLQNLERFRAEPRARMAVVGGDQVKDEVTVRVGGQSRVVGGFEQRAEFMAVAGSVLADEAGFG